MPVTRQAIGIFVALSAIAVLFAGPSGCIRTAAAPGACDNTAPKQAEDKVCKASNRCEVASADGDIDGCLSWPVEGEVVAKYGLNKGVQYNGIGIRAPEGTVVRAAADGTVGHVGAIPGYGNLVLIKHAERLVTVYAHLKRITVNEGESVKKGDKIGTVGASGRTDAPALYFEVRSRSKPTNPLFFLQTKG